MCETILAGREQEAPPRREKPTDPKPQRKGNGRERETLVRCKKVRQSVRDFLRARRSYEDYESQNRKAMMG